MKLLLVYPGFADGFGSYRAGANWFHHGTGIISALLKRDGHSISYMDCRKLSGWEEVEKTINASEFEAALISVATVDFNAARRIAGLVKKKNQGLSVIVGGPHATLMTEETAGAAEFDHIFTHEAEVTLPLVLQDLKSAPRIIRGEMPPDLDALPFVDRSLAPEGESTGLWDMPSPYFSITASRGCLYNCSFCQPAERAVFGNKVRRRGIGNVLDELENLSREYGMKSFMIHDDCFTQYHEWAEEFCEKKKARGLNQPFVCQSRADIICRRPDLMRRLRKAGLTWVYMQRPRHKGLRELHVRPSHRDQRGDGPDGGHDPEDTPRHVQPVGLYPGPGQRSLRLLHGAGPQPDHHRGRLPQERRQRREDQRRGLRLRGQGDPREHAGKLRVPGQAQARPDGGNFRRAATQRQGVTPI